jgi:hypothetical protein
MDGKKTQKATIPELAPFWNGIQVGAIVQLVASGFAIVAGAPDRFWVPAFITCGALVCGKAAQVIERHWTRPTTSDPKIDPH